MSSRFRSNRWGSGMPSNAPAGARIVGAIMGFVFGGIGLTVLIFLWGAPFDEFGSPPLFFRVFASFIAIAFVGVGSTAFYTAIRGGSSGSSFPGSPTNLSQGLQPATPASPPPSSPAPSASGYQCPNCGAPLDRLASVSPLGDVRCPFCHSWFNVHRRSSN